MVSKPPIINCCKLTDLAELRCTSLCSECLVDFGLPQTFWITRHFQTYSVFTTAMLLFIWVSDRDFLSQPKGLLNNKQKRMWSIGLVFWNVSPSVAVESSNMRFMGLVVQTHGDYRDPCNLWVHITPYTGNNAHTNTWYAATSIIIMKYSQF